MEKVNQDQMLTLTLMLMPGTDITAIHGDMEDGDGVDTTDHTDTDTGAVRRGPPRMEMINPDPTPTLMLMPGMDITAVHGDMEDGDGVDTTDHTDTEHTGAVKRGQLRMEMINLDPTPMQMPMPITGTGADGEAMEDGDGEDITDHGDTDTGAVRRGPLRMEMINPDPTQMQMPM